MHPLWGGVELAGPDVRDLASVEAVAAEVRRYAAEHPDEEWVLGGPYDPALAPRGLFDAALEADCVAVARERRHRGVDLLIG